MLTVRIFPMSCGSNHYVVLPGRAHLPATVDNVPSLWLPGLTPELSRFKVLRERVLEVTTRLLKQRLPQTNAMVENLIAIELAYINTNHSQFESGSGAMVKMLTRMNEQMAHNAGDAARGVTRDTRWGLCCVVCGGDVVVVVVVVIVVVVVVSGGGCGWLWWCGGGERLRLYCGWCWCWCGVVWCGSWCGCRCRCVSTSGGGCGCSCCAAGEVALVGVVVL